jgi:tetratricopeptide (TPR) repeat protein
MRPVLRRRRAGGWRVGLGVALAVAHAPLALARAGGGDLGRVSFPVTGGPVARRHFTRGLLALHSFWYEEARDEFRAATRAEPGFVMGRWGEALTWYHPIWGQEDVAAERAALDAVSAQPAATPRELAYLEAARALVGAGDFASHAARYRDAMRAVHGRWPDDDEAAALYAVALLGTVDRKAPSFRPQAEAGALMLELFARNPDHPGAAHYIIHAFDDPDHARLALPAARRYARVAPAAFHALHMPSHIFVHLGMWEEAAASNEAAWAASQAWIARKRLDASLGDFHSLSWLEAVYLELGEGAKAAEVLARGRAAVGAAREDRAWLRVDLAKMALDAALATGDFSRLDAAPPPAVDGPATAAAPATVCHGRQEGDAAKAARRERGLTAAGRAEAALARRDAAAARAAIDDLAATLTSADEPGGAWRVTERVLRGRVLALGGRLEEGAGMVKAAADLEDAVAPSGPVEGVTARERLGELLLGAGRPSEALVAFRRALELHPRRARALLGCARAAKAAGDESAATYWPELARLWAHADADTPGLDEARRATAPR